MEIFEKVNRAFGSWYEGLFGGSDDVRPKDILRRIFVAMEENRKEHLDDKIYVPNHYVLEIAVDDEEEKEYLRSFLVCEELETAVRRYCKQNHYEIRGGLQFTIREVEPDAEREGRRREKVRVRCRYDSTIPAPVVQEPAAIPVPAAMEVAPVADNDQTVFSAYQDAEMGTVPAVAAARLAVTPPGLPPFEYTIAKAAVTIGRSPSAGNDIVIPEDVRLSRRHARMELDADGRFTIYDLDTTNGTRVNGRRIDNQALDSGDEINIGATRIVFTRDVESDAGARGRSVEVEGRSPRLVVMDGDRDVEEFVLGSETVVGRGTTNDIVLDDRSVATRHVLLTAGAPYCLEVLDANHLTLLNGTQLRPGDQKELQTGDRIGLGTATLRFEQPEESGR